MIGTTLGSYKILDKLGEGGMGVVYAAEHALIGKKAAVKMLRRECSSDEEIVNRFFNEARSTAMIRHSGLVDVFDFGYHSDGSAYIVMEFLEGESLASRIERRTPFSLGELVSIARQLAVAVGAAHAKGIVHRDLKPDNVFLVPDDVDGGIKVKVLDFGIAKLAGDVGSSVKTRTGSMMGTPLYMAPEQCRGAGEVDGRADIYSFGCILYEMVTGRPPFLGDGPGDVIVGHMMEPPVPPSQLRQDVNPGLEALVLRMLAKKAADRPQTMDEVALALDGLVGRQRSTTGAGVKIGADRGRQRAASGLEETAAAPSLPPARTPSLPPSVTQPTPAPSGMLAAAASLPAQPAAPLGTLQPGVAEQLRAPRGANTTMGGSASEVMATAGPPARRGKGLWLGLAGGLLAAGAAAAFLLTRPGRSKPDHRAAAGPSTVVAPASPSSAPALLPSPAASAAPLVSAPALPALVRLSIDSSPQGAEVYRVVDGALLGTTPHIEETPPTKGQAVFVLKLAGHADARVALFMDRDGSATQVLEPVKDDKAGRSGRRGKRGTSGGGTREVNDGTVDPFKR